MDDILAEVLAEATAEPEGPANDGGTAAPPANDVATDAEPVAEEQQEPAKQAAKPPSIDDETAFSDEALSGPEQIRAARKLVQDKRRDAQRKSLELERREARFKKDKGEVLQLRDNMRAQFNLLQNDIQALRTGDAAAAMAALSRLTGGKNATELWEEISLNVARNGKRTESTELRELRDQMFEMRNAWMLRDKRDAEREQQAREQHEQRAIIEKLSPAQFPILAGFAKDNPDGVAADVAAYVLRQHQAGVRVDYETAISQIESQLRARLAPAFSVPSSQGEGSGRETGASANPVLPQVGKTIAPSLTTQNGGMSRGLSEAERLQKAAQELPQAFWDQFNL